MYYGVVAPGLNMVYRSYQDVERVMALYPYPKFRKFTTEEAAWDFVHRYNNNHEFRNIKCYGDIFEDHYITMEYFVQNDSIYYNFRTEKLGFINLAYDGADIAYGKNLIMVKLSNFTLDRYKISSHLIAIYHGLKIIGDFVDVDVVLKDHSVFYMLMSYTGTNRVVRNVLDFIKSRIGNVSMSLPDFGEEEEVMDD